MKKTLSLALALLLSMTALVSCNEEPAETTPAGDAGTTVATTTKDTPKQTIPQITTDPNEDPGEPELPYDEYDLPNATSGDLALKAYEAQGYFDYEGDVITSVGNNNMAIVTNDTMAAGKLTATFTAIPGNNNDNGIFFGMEDDVNETYFFWENGPAYYFLFVSDASTLYLAKASYNGQAWTVLQDTGTPIANYTHGETEVTITAEFDGTGNIKCYANGELLIDYTDAAPLSGSRYGIRCEVSGVVYTSVVAEHN